MLTSQSSFGNRPARQGEHTGSSASEALATTTIPIPRRACRSHIVIPARLASTRLPEKLLLRETGKSVLQHTHEAACRARRPSGVTVAVDCERLFEEVQRFGGTAVLTDPNLPSGTDRVVEVARLRADVDVFINVQGDEPEICGTVIDRVVDLLDGNPQADVATLATRIRQREHLDDPSCVKVVCDQQGHALYFSRSPIPHARSWDSSLLNTDPPLFLQHLGIYAYRRDFLLRLQHLPASPLEELEKLEQLRFLQAGCAIQLAVVEHAARGIDTAADYHAFVQRFRAAA